MGMSDGLERIYDDADLDRLRAAHLLISLPQSESLRVNPDVADKPARSATVDRGLRLRILRGPTTQRFGEPLTVTSAARNGEFPGSAAKG